MFFEFLYWTIGRLIKWVFRLQVEGLENLPKHGALLCPNHASDWDPVLIGVCLPHNYHLRIMAKEALFHNKALAWLIRKLGAFPVTITKKRPVTDAIVTTGGVKVGEVDPKTMESKLFHGLYLAGELLDADAYTGGFNLQIAWATGRAAGAAAAQQEGQETQ